jgi:WD40 repeat protein
MRTINLPRAYWRLFALMLAWCPLGLTASLVPAQPLAEKPANKPTLAWQIRKPHPIYSVAFSPDGKTLVAGGASAKVKCLNSRTGRLKKTLPPFKAPKSSEGAVRVVRFAPDGRYLVVAGAHGVRILNVSSGAVRVNLPDRQDVHSVALSRDGRTLLFGSSNPVRAGQVELWDTKTWTVRRAFPHHSYWPGSADLSRDGRTVVNVGSPRNEVQVWDAETGDLKRTLTGHQYVINCVAVSPDGMLAASGGRDSAVRLWDLKTGEMRWSAPASGGQSLALAFSPDGSVLASADYATSVRAWDTRTGELRWTVMRDAENPWPTGDFLLTSIAFSPDGKLLASAGCDQRVRVWRLK